MLSYFIIGVIIIIPCIGLILIAMALGTDYKYRDLDAEDKPLVMRGQGDFRTEIRPSHFDYRDLVRDRGPLEPPFRDHCRWCSLGVEHHEQDCTSCDGPDEHVAPDGGRAS